MEHISYLYNTPESGRQSIGRRIDSVFIMSCKWPLRWSNDEALEAYHQAQDGILPEAIAENILDNRLAGKYDGGFRFA